MTRRIPWGLALLGLMLSAAVLEASGGDQAMSPVGAWTIRYEPDADSPGDPNTTLAQYHRGGTLSGAAWTDPWTNSAGSWEKVGSNRYRCTFYVMIPDGNGYLRIVEEFWMLDKDRMEGRQESWWVPGQDPLADAVAPLWWGFNSYRRIRAEPKQLP